MNHRPYLSFILFIFFFASLAKAEIFTSTVDLKPPTNKKSLWSAKIESDAKTTRNNINEIDGYTTETDFQINRMFDASWGLLGGIQAANDSRDEKRGGLHADEASFGVRLITYLANTKWRSDFTYDYLLLEYDRKKNFRPGSFSVDIQTNFFLGYWGKAKIKLKHSEYLPANSTNVEVRQTKIEFSPAYLFAVTKISAGIKNRIFHLWTDKNEFNTYELGPFLKYEGDRFEPLVKISYRPIEKSKNMLIADNWQSKPVYSVEMEMKF